MKRKHGNKKGKTKNPSVTANGGVPNVGCVDTGDNSGVDVFDNDEFDSGAETETPSSTGTDLPQKLASVNPGGLIDKAAGKSVYGRVKVKIRTSKALDSQLTSSDAPTQSDTDKSSQHVSLEKHGVLCEKMEDSGNSLPEININVSGSLSKKAGRIKIKPSMGFSSSSISPCNNVGLFQGERTQQKEPELLHRQPRNNEQELNASLEVIKKVMKMDAAEPFSVPVNPIALGIPDYFDVIDTPMDFGTVCSNLENGVKYMNSDDVFKDVQYIWDNCYKYNNKGDYILELMKRVKKNFIKYWTSAGLYIEQLKGTNGEGFTGAESIQAKDVALSSHGKKSVEVGHLKHKARKRPGVKRHKDDCQCAICVMMRRRQEREDAQITENQTETSEDHLIHEETSPVQSPCGEDTSSNMENSPDQDTDTELEDKGEDVKLEDTESPEQEKQEEKENQIPFQSKGASEISENSELDDRSKEVPNRQHQTPGVESSGHIQNGTWKEEISVHPENETARIEQKKVKDSLEESQKAKMYENLRSRFENPVLLELCGTVFTEKRNSAWSGPHSIVRLQGSFCSSSIDAAISTFMK